MDIFQIIQDDHRQVMDVIEQLKATDDMSVKRRSERMRMLKDLLQPHMAGEETLVYPVLQGPANDEEMFQHANEEHHEARVCLNEILYMKDCNDPNFVSKLEELQTMLQDHIEEEESAVFDSIRAVLSENQLDEMGRQFQEFKDQYQSPEGEITRRAA